MTTKRRIKKEIDYIVSDLILDCFTYTNVTAEPNDEVIGQIISETLLLRNQLRDQANHPEEKSGSVSSKAYYDTIARKLIESINSSYEKLEKLVSKE